MRLPGELSQSGGNVVAVETAEEVDGGIAEGREVLRGGATADTAGVFGERYVPNVVDAVLDPPVVTPPSQELSSIRHGPRCAGDGVLNFDESFTTSPGRSYQPADLSGVGPEQVPAQTCRGLEPAMYQTPVLFGPGLGYLDLREPLIFSGRGKKPP